VLCPSRSFSARSCACKGFGNTTLLIADKKVGVIFTMLLAPHNDDAKATMEKAVKRQQTKHMTFHVPTNEPVPPPADAKGTKEQLATTADSLSKSKPECKPKEKTKKKLATATSSLFRSKKKIVSRLTVLAGAAGAPHD
jgi:hypothetical protein